MVLPSNTNSTKIKPQSAAIIVSVTPFFGKLPPKFIYIYLYTLFIQKFQFSVVGLNGDLYKITCVNNKL